MLGFAALDLLCDEADVPFASLDDPFWHDRQDNRTDINESLKGADVVYIHDGVEDHGHPRMVFRVFETVKGLIEGQMANDVKSHILPTLEVSSHYFSADSR